MLKKHIIINTQIANYNAIFAQRLLSETNYEI